MLWIKRILVGKDLFVLAGSHKRTFSTSPAVSIEKSERAAAVLARCSIDLPVVLFCTYAKTLSLVLSELSGKFFWETLALNVIYLFLCPAKRGDGGNRWISWRKRNGVRLWSWWSLCLSHCVGFFTGLSKWVYVVPVCPSAFLCTHSLIHGQHYSSVFIAQVL